MLRLGYAEAGILHAHLLGYPDRSERDFKALNARRGQRHSDKGRERYTWVLACTESKADHRTAYHSGSNRTL